MLDSSHNISVFSVWLEKYDWSTSFFVKSLWTDWGLVLQNQNIIEDPLKKKIVDMAWGLVCFEH